jgi:hypothetical protein
MLTLGGAGLIALGILVARPQEFAGLLQAAGIRAPAFPRILTSAIAEDWVLDLAMPLGVVALGVFMIFTRPRIERMVLAIAATMVFTTVAVNVVVIPAIANTLSLRDFTDHAMKIVGDSPVGYLGALNYDVAFYSRRTIPIVAQRNPQMPEYLIAWRTLFNALPASRQNRFDIVITSNPTSLDGTDEMLLLHQRAGSPDPPSRKPSDDYIQAGNSTTWSLFESRRPLSPAAAAPPPIRRANSRRNNA